VDVESESGKGTRFTVRLPLISAVSLTPGTENGSAPAQNEALKSA
jgi:hypothetical protein